MEGKIIEFEINQNINLARCHTSKQFYINFFIQLYYYFNEWIYYKKKKKKTNFTTKEKTLLEFQQMSSLTIV